ncbi:MAG: DUF1592 domain-containing protein, partial [Verrucomicrobiota bacterium]
PLLSAQFGYFVSGLTINLTKDIGTVPVTSEESAAYELSVPAELLPQPEASVPADKRNSVVLLSNALEDGGPPPKTKTIQVEEEKNGKTRMAKKKVWLEDPHFPKIIIESVEWVENDYEEWPSPLHRNLHAVDESITDSLRNFLRKAWRRPPTETELAKWSSHFQSVRQTMDSDLSALRETFAAALASPHFLYLSEPERDGGLLSAHEIAARLALFLWSSVPDQALNAAADDQSLLDPERLREEIVRMIADPKTDRMAEAFCSQWLDLEGVDRVAVNPQVFRNFDNELKKDMISETQAFFLEVFRKDESALCFLEADFAMLNGRLAKHYGIPGPNSQRFERTPLPANGDRPGGLLGHASVFLSGSDGADSHPIKRAVWIRERLLHDPPKPPPPDVPDLAASVPNLEKLTVREQLEIHAKKAACADCHRSIDPWGIALEGYDAIGLPREKTRRNAQEVSTTTTLPSGHQVQGIEDLQDYLVSHRKDQFAHALVSKLFTYALGRSVDLKDELVLEEVTHAFQESGYRLSSLVESICLSDPFLHR